MSMYLIDESREVLAPERGNLALSELIGHMVHYMNKVRELSDTLRLDDDNEREQYINAVHDVTGKLLLLTMALPEKWSIDRDLKYLREYMELALREKIDLTADDDEQAYRFAKRMIAEAKNPEDAEKWLQELGRGKTYKQVEKILSRVKNKIKESGKENIRQQAEKLFELASPQVDPETDEWKRGIFDAKQTFRIQLIKGLWNMSERTWRYAMQTEVDAMEENEEASSKSLFFYMFGSFERMSVNEAVHAFEEMKKYVRDGTTTWEDKRLARREHQTRLSQSIIQALQEQNRLKNGNGKTTNTLPIVVIAILVLLMLFVFPAVLLQTPGDTVPRATKAIPAPATSYIPPLASADSEEGYELRSIFREDWDTARRVYGQDWLDAYNAATGEEQQKKALHAYIDRAFGGNWRAAAKWYGIGYPSGNATYYEKIKESSLRQQARRNRLNRRTE